MKFFCRNIPVRNIFLYYNTFRKEKNFYISNVRLYRYII
nr:MAG TPA: hypothetical protein [Caudoviricetes sp.]